MSLVRGIDMRKSDRVYSLTKKISSLQSKYNKTGDLDIRDALIRAKRELGILQGSCLRSNNIYTCNSSVYVRDTGCGLRGQH